MGAVLGWGAGQGRTVRQVGAGRGQYTAEAGWWEAGKRVTHEWTAGQVGAWQGTGQTAGGGGEDTGLGQLFPPATSAFQSSAEPTKPSLSSATSALGSKGRAWPVLSLPAQAKAAGLNRREPHGPGRVPDAISWQGTGRLARSPAGGLSWDLPDKPQEELGREALGIPSAWGRLVLAAAKDHTKPLRSSMGAVAL